LIGRRKTHILALSLQQVTRTKERIVFISCFTDELKADVAEALPILKEWGLKYVDLRGRVFEMSIHGLSDEQLGELRDLIDAHGMRVGAIESSLAKVHMPDGERQASEAKKLEGLIRAADTLDCRLVRAFFYWQPEEGAEKLHERPETLEQVREMFQPLADRADEAGLVLAFENCGQSNDEVFAMLDALDVPRWGLAWDVHNEWFDSPQREDDEAAYVRCLAERTRILHVKAEGAVAGGGERIPYNRVLAGLAEVGFDGPVSIETHNRDHMVSFHRQTRDVLTTLRAAWPAPRASAKPKYDPVGFVVVGLGMGSARARQILRTPGTRLVGVCDIDQERARTVGEEMGVPYTFDVAPWLENDEVEAVFVMTETGNHARVAIPALEAGKHVLSTKPMDVSLEACDAMIKLAEERDLVLAVDFEFRCDAQTLALREAIRSERFGRMLGGTLSLKVLRTMDYFRARGGWRGTWKLDGGGVLCNQNIHYIDMLGFVLGAPARVKCEIRTLNHEIETEDVGCAMWEYPDGAILNLYATTCFPNDSWYYEMELFGTEGAASLASGGPLDSTRARWFRDGAWSDEPPVSVEPEWLNSMDNFAAALRTGAPLICPPHEGRLALVILGAMYRSAREQGGGWVEVEE